MTMTADLYKNGMELLDQIYNNFSDEDKQWFKTEEPAAMHSSLGRHLRNHCKMWETKWTPEIINNIDHSPNHPDAISMKVIRDYQEKVNNAAQTS